MKSKRRPALTSPWKIGFLVSLFLILMGIGVSFILFRTFDLSWSWLGFKQGRWFFEQNRFIYEMLPLICVAILFCFTAYFSVTAAVRRYKAYLDSGYDYRHLIQSIREISDLESEEKLQRLGAYPELRDFLVAMRDQVREKQDLLSKREAALAKKGKSRKSDDALKQQCTALAGVIRGFPGGGVPEDLEITVPELTPIEEALHAISSESGGSRWGDQEERKLGELQEKLQNASRFLESRLAALAGELKESRVSAQDIESRLAELRTLLSNPAEAPAETGGGADFKAVRQMLRTLGELSDSLLELGEEAKGIAISTALQAGSGEGTLADLIQLAEDVREIAGRFTDMAQSFKAATDQVESSMASLEIFSGPSGKRDGIFEDAASAAGSLANKVSLWVERVLILSDKMKNVEQTFNLSLGPFEDKPAAPEQKTDVDIDQQGFPDGLLVEMHREESVFSEAGAPTSGLSGIEKEQDAIFEGSAEPGGMFDELTGMEPTETAPTAEEKGVDFEKLPSGGTVQEIDEVPDVEDTSSDQIGFAHLPSDAAGGDVHSSKKSRDYGTVDLEEAAVERMPRGAAQAPDAHPHVSPAAVKDEDAIDLYALGAVDYEENDIGKI